MIPSTYAIPLHLPDRDRSSLSGGLIAADVDGDAQNDILVTVDGLVAAYSLTGEDFGGDP
ncbi:hypothetical protein HC928_12255 [bacterium]|nr:hypothetical protein [bacterium]